MAAPRGKARRVIAKTLRDSLRNKTPARGACREAIQEQSIRAKKTRPRQEELAGKANQGITRKLAATHHAPRQGSVSDKLPGPTRRQPRQGTCRGKRYLRAQAPAHPPTCRPGTLPGARGERLCSQRCTVASGTDKKAIMAIGGAPDGLCLHYLGDTDGHLMPLSPAVRVRYDTLYLQYR